MRALIIIIVIFSLLCAAVTFNFMFINKVSDELSVLAHSLDYSNVPKCERTLGEIDSLWEKSSDIFSLSVNFREIDYLGETLLSLSSALEDRDERDFERYRLLLIDAIDGVRRLEKLSLFNII